MIPLDSITGSGDMNFHSVVIRQLPDGYMSGEIFLDDAQYDMIITALEEDEGLRLIPKKLALKQNYPKVKIKLQSNIRMFSVEAFLVRAKDYIDQIQTTFHSNKMEIFDAITRVKGSFNQVIKALNLIKKHKVDIYFNILILKQNYNHLRDTVLFLRKIFPSKLILLDYPFYLNEAVRNKSLIHVSFKQAKPFIEDACVDGYVRIYNIPPCVFDEKILSNVAQQGFIHDDRYIYPLKECQDCTLKKFCIGYYKQNLTLFKNYDDFKPRK